MKYIKLVTLLISIVAIAAIGLNIYSITVCNTSIIGQNDIKGEKVYNIMKSVITKKYENLLYNTSKEFCKLYSFNNKDNAKKIYDTEYYNTFLSDYDSFEIYNIQSASLGRYVIYYRTKFVGDMLKDEDYFKEYKIVVKYDEITNSAVICADNEVLEEI